MTIRRLAWLLMLRSAPAHDPLAGPARPLPPGPLSKRKPLIPPAL